MANKFLKDTDNTPNDIHEGYKIKELYEIMSLCLDKLGYSVEMVQYRRDMNAKIDDIYNYKQFAVNSITTGGKADGSALYFESDIDRLYVVKGITCTMSDVSCENCTILYIDRQGCSHGYTRLKILSLQDEDIVLRNYLVHEENKIYVSNRFALFTENTHMLDINGMAVHQQDKSGPTDPYGNMFIEYDFVFGFECSCPDLIAGWANRTRKYDWPDNNLILHVSALEGHVVPVANKGSRYPNTEWRICFTKAEMALLDSFDEFQFKAYICLKLIAKAVLKPISTEMSSYIMKNIVFWVAETHLREAFTKQTLIDRVVDSLVFLEECLRQDSLKSYMIPERNLFEGRIHIQERDSLVNKISEIRDNREDMFQQSKKLRNAMIKIKVSPTEFVEEAEKRDKVEKLVYKKNVIFKEIESTPGIGLEMFKRLLKENELYRQYEEELYELVILDRKDMLDNSEEVYRERLASILS